MNIITPVKWIQEPDENGTGFLLGETAEFPIPIETHNVTLEEVTLGEPQEFNFIIEAAKKVEVFKDEADYYANAATHFASESFIPSGLFSSEPSNKDFVQSPKAIITGPVTMDCDDPLMCGFDEDDTLFTMTCLGMEFDAFVSGSLQEEIDPKPGNIVSGFFWVQGWPEDRSDSSDADFDPAGADRGMIEGEYELDDEHFPMLLFEDEENLQQSDSMQEDNLFHSYDRATDNSD